MPEAGLFMSLNTGVLGMYTQQMAMSVVAHNIANANTPGFSRQRAVITTMPPLPMQTLTQTNMPISFGTGSKVKDVQRIRDSFLDLQYRQANSKLGFWDEVNTQFQYIEQLVGMPGSTGLRSQYDEFWKAAQQVATTPSSVGAKAEFVQSAKALLEKVQSVYKSLEAMKGNYTHQLEAEAENVNSILKNIADLNVKIRESSVLGNKPNDLLDKRDLLLDKLSKETNFKMVTYKDGEIAITINGINVLSGQKYVPLKFQRINGKPNKSFLSVNNIPLIPTEGKIGALFHLRDKVVSNYESVLNGFMLNLGDKVNTILNQSYDQNGNHGQSLFNFESVPGQTNALYRIESANPPDGIVYDPKKKLSELFAGISGDVTLNVNGAVIKVSADDSLDDLISKVNAAKVGVEFSLAPRGNLVVRATKGDNYDLLRQANGNENPVEIKAVSDGAKALLKSLGFTLKSDYSVDLKHYAEVADETQALSVSFNNPVLHMSVNSSLLSDPSRVATDFSPQFLSSSAVGTVSPTGEQGSGGMQLIVDLKTYDYDNVTSMDGFFGNFVSQMGIEGQNASAMYNNTSSLVNQIEHDRQEVSSVSINDEMSQMLLYQNAYTASARVISTVNSMIQTLVNMVR
ncbi:flagellar hook-associated protein FlgK [Mesoaciditoga sp.]